MPLTREKAKENLSGLLIKFQRELAAHKIREYNEEATKTAFIQPLLKDVLGWDVNDRDEVSPEEKISRGRVDYGLKVEGKTKIFVEAKPPRADLSRHIDQAVRYGYNRKGVPFVLLTDFEGIKLFDVTVKPDFRNPLKGLKLELEWGQYLNRFEHLWQLSKESVAAGKLDELLRVKPKDRLPVDRAILEDLKRWREILAKDIFKNNPELFHSGEKEKDADYLKEITQKILDRIIFMRSCEDRALYHGRSLKEIFEERTDAVGTGSMVFLKKEFESYNIFFDSDLFSPREWEAKLAVDFKVMQEIILDTYNPYQFDIIPLEVLGNIYEQYLGYNVRLTEHQVKYELKPEVRKAGGVYYTPEYIVDHIVKNTIGQMLLEVPESKVKKLRILDPACGSGSFLIRAYEEMLRYYQEQKTKKIKPREGEKKLGLPEEKLRLSIDEKKNILIQHIFGVDIDEQAVEVTKLSLMLKMLDGEHGIPAGRGILPMLDKNIKCGNSLISGNALELHKYFGEDWYRVKPFNWEDEFPHIMKDENGFDAVIGNPPWGAFFDEDERGFLSKKYFLISRKTKDSYLYFILRALGLVKKNGFVGMIVPNTWLLVNNAVNFRRELLSLAVKQIIDHGDGVFKEATVESATLLLKKNKSNEKCRAIRIKKGHVISDQMLDKKLWLDDEFCRIICDVNIDIKAILLKIDSLCIPFQRNCSICWGIKPYQEGYGHPPQTRDVINKRIYHSEKKLGNLWKPLLVGADIDRYIRIFGGNRFIKYGDWLMYPSNERLMIGPKILMRQTSDILRTCYDEKGFYCQNSVFIVHSNEINQLYLMALLNSKLLNFVYKMKNPQIGKVFPEIKPSVIKQLPIRNPRRDPNLNAAKDRIISLARVMLLLNERIQTAKGAEKDQIQRQIDKTDREIDDLVYKLYEIADGERRIIEGGTT